MPMLVMAGSMSTAATSRGASASRSAVDVVELHDLGGERRVDLRAHVARLRLAACPSGPTTMTVSSTEPW